MTTLALLYMLNYGRQEHEEMGSRSTGHASRKPGHESQTVAVKKQNSKVMKTPVGLFIAI